MRRQTDSRMRSRESEVSNLTCHDRPPSTIVLTDHTTRSHR
jgi:hypothetical protein